MARRSKATEARIEALLVALRAGNTRDAAAGHAGIVRTTLYRWLERDPALRTRVEKAEADAEVRFAAQVARGAGDDWRAAGLVARASSPRKLWASAGCRGCRHHDGADAGPAPDRRPHS